MRRLIFSMAVLFLVLGLVVTKRIYQTPAPAPTVVMEVLDPSLEQYAAAWQKEIARRFPDAVGVLCHGGNFIGQEWIVTAKSFEHYSTAQDVIRYEQGRYPGKTIVLLACNPGHLDLGIPGVYFANDSVWCVPDRAVANDLQHATERLDSGFEPGFSRWDSDPGVVGNVFEFISD